MEQKRPLGYLAGGIMTHGENLARQEEYDKFKAAGIPGEVYSPVQNKSINDKSNMTEEENNHLAEKIVEADTERLWNSDYTVLCPEQSAIGTMCEVGILYGWKYMAEKIMHSYQHGVEEGYDYEIILDAIMDVVKDNLSRKNYAHYFDIRTNHLNEKDWRRSFSINQMLYGIILYATEDHTLHNSFDEIIPILQKEYPKEVRYEDIKKLLNSLPLKTTDIIYCNTKFARTLCMTIEPVVMEKEHIPYPDPNRDGYIGSWRGTSIYVDNCRFPDDKQPHASVLSVDNIKEIL